jgi:hypothetical protein
MALGIVASLLSGYLGHRQFEADMRKWESWPATPGSPVNMRVVEQPMITLTYRSFRKKMFVVECLVTYSVSGKQYSVWADSYHGTDVSQFTESASVCPYPSYSVRYDPQRPSTAHAFIADPALP